MANKRLYIAILFCIFSVNQLFPQKINQAIAVQVAASKIASLNHAKGFQLAGDPLLFQDESGNPLFYMFSIEPTGYMAVCADQSLPPVIAYSLTNDWGKNSPENLLLKLIKGDLNTRMKNLHLVSESEKTERMQQWQEMISGTSKSVLFEQWPPEGTTSTGGWLETNWKQGTPYNQFCPMDPVTSQRSIAGCPSVAIGMLINYYENIFNTKLTDDQDDYYHSYAGRNYQIDDDFETIDFLTFPEINSYLDTINNSWMAGNMPKPEEAAALIWACGVAAQQVYTSSISGTFGVDQAFAAFQRFGYEDAELLYPGDPILETLSLNMMEARPALLAVIDPGVAGHNLVTDGYNTDDFYHLNFGWGGSYNGWYLIPDEIPYNLTEFEGVVANIAFAPVSTSIDHLESDDISIDIQPNPTTNALNIQVKRSGSENAILEIYNSEGKIVFQENNNQKTFSKTIGLKSDLNLKSGIYFLGVKTNTNSTIQKILLR